jgi:hypothetical protein
VGDIMREIHDDNVRRARLSPLDRAREDLPAHNWRVDMAKAELRNAIAARKAHRGTIARLEKEARR